MRILITGSRGFVGGSMGRYAVREGHEVMGISRPSQPEEGWLGFHVCADAAISDLARVIDGFAPDCIIHCAGSASVAASLKHPLDDLKASVMTWANTLDSVRRSGVRPLIVFPSSAAVYGNPKVLPVKENLPISPISPYGFHKASCEYLAHEYSSCFGLNIIICRLFSVMGPMQKRLLVWDIYRQLRSNEEIVWLDGLGSEGRDYLHVDDVASAILQITETLKISENRSELLTVNIASGQMIGVLQLAKRLRDLVASNKQIRCRGKARKGDPDHWQADISLLLQLIPSWRPKSLDEALRRCIEAWQRGGIFLDDEICV